MWFQKKEEMYLGGFVRMLASVLIQDRNVDLSIVNKDGDISPEEEALVQEELPYFRIVLLMFLLADTGGKFGSKVFSEQEISSTVVQGTILAFDDSGIKEKELEARGERLQQTILNYLSALEKTDAEEIQNKGIFFFLCTTFADRMMAKAGQKKGGMAGLGKHFIFFDIAKQVYRNNEEAFKGAIKTVKFLD